MAVIKKFSYNYARIFPFISWILFSVFYWYAAYVKPFTNNGFFSWVYASRCNCYEILTLKDTGIGHPPFFHLLQKLVQYILPGYHFLYVRIINYILGILFIILLVKYLVRYKKEYFFIFSLSLSAAVLNTFVHARMWGGVAFFSLILIVLGESYLDIKKKHYLFLMSIIFLLGLFFDYNFILMAPYFFFVFIEHLKNEKKLKFLAFSFLLLIWAVAFIISVYKFGFSQSIYINIANVFKMGFNLYNLMFYSWYIEIIVLIMFFLWGVLLVQYRKNEYNLFHAFLVVVLFLGVVFIFINSGYLRIRFSLLLLPIPIIFYFKIKNKLLFNSFTNRFTLSIVFGSIIILSISPLFWRDLVINRFIIIFIPMIIILIYRNFSGKVLNVLAVIFLLSGFSFSFSSYLNDYYLPSYFTNNKKTIFQNVGFYSSQYLKNDIYLDETVKLLDLSKFEYSCRVCIMGTDQIDYSKLDSIRFVSYDQMPIKLLLKGYKIKSSEIFGLTELDKIQLKYLTPLYRNYSILYEMVKKNEEVE